MKFTFFSRTVHQLVNQWNCFLVRLPSSLLLMLRLRNSRDLNPVDYRIWRVRQEREYHMPIQDVAYQWQARDKHVGWFPAEHS